LWIAQLLRGQLAESFFQKHRHPHLSISTLTVVDYRVKYPLKFLPLLSGECNIGVGVSRVHLLFTPFFCQQKDKDAPHFWHFARTFFSCLRVIFTVVLSPHSAHWMDNCIGFRASVLWR
jgi:hypothetical protein